MNQTEKNKWLKEHIPYRVRVSIALLKDMQLPYMQTTIFFNPRPTRMEEKKQRRCETDAIYTGRLAAMRWLIEFIIDPPRRGDDVRIGGFNGCNTATLIPDELKLLKDFQDGCHKATSHATCTYNHNDISEPKLKEALNIIIRHLQSTIYNAEGLSLMGYVFETPPA